MTGTEHHPSVSVVVPSYGRPDALRHCLKALARLDYPGPIEIIVVDDGSSAPLEQTLGDLSVERPYRIVRQSNRGPAAARNLGARLATGENLAFTDDDCRPHRDWLKRLLPTLESDSSTMVGGRTLNALESNIWARASQDLVSFLYDSFPRARALRPFFTTNNVAMTRSRFLEIDGFDETFVFTGAEDRDLAERWVLAGGRLHFQPDAVVDHFHQLSALRFARQHFGYGRGATHLARRRRRRGQGSPAVEPFSFYWRMFTYPFGRRPLVPGLISSVLMWCAQLFGVAGMLFEWILPARRGQVAGDDQADLGGEGHAELVVDDPAHLSGDDPAREPREP